jgi:hypothetical protein
MLGIVYGLILLAAARAGKGKSCGPPHRHREPADGVGRGRYGEGIAM